MWHVVAPRPSTSIAQDLLRRRGAQAGLRGRRLLRGDAPGDRVRLGPGADVLAIISLSLAIINLFPFLPLDGGHIFWAVAEKVRGRAIPFAVMERASVVGLRADRLLFAIGLTNDIGAARRRELRLRRVAVVRRATGIGPTAARAHGEQHDRARSRRERATTIAEAFRITAREHAGRGRRPHLDGTRLAHLGRAARARRRARRRARGARRRAAARPSRSCSSTARVPPRRPRGR